jgi:hypothetical protein
MAVPVIMLVSGAAMTAAAAIGGGSLPFVAGLASLTAVFTAVFWWMGRGRGDMADLAANRPDERQRLMDQRAAAFAGVAVGVFCLGAAVVSLARGGTGNPWAAIDALFGAVYVASFLVLRRR